MNDKITFKNEAWNKTISFALEPWGYCYGLEKGDEVKVIFSEEYNDLEFWYDEIESGKLLSVDCPEPNKIYINNDLVLDLSEDDSE